MPQGVSGKSDSIVIDACAPRIASTEFLERIRAAGVTASCVTLAGQVGDFFSAVAEMNMYYNLVDAFPDKTMLVTQASDIRRAKEKGALGIVFSFQNATPLGDDWVNRLPVFYRNGVRMVQITYNERNLLGDGCLEPENRGLTQYGRQVVHGLNQLGIVIDLSHVGDQTVLDTIERSQAPCVFSHANCRSLTPSPRNKTDDQVRALAEAGGVMCITPYAPFCESVPGQRPTMKDVLNHIDHAIDLAGIDHVGIGTDIAEHWAVRWMGGTPKRYPEVVGNYTWQTIYAEGFHTISGLSDLPTELGKRGYKAKDISKILGGNMLRVFDQVWKQE